MDEFNRNDSLENNNLDSSANGAAEKEMTADELWDFFKEAHDEELKKCEETSYSQTETAATIAEEAEEAQGVSENIKESNTEKPKKKFHYNYRKSIAVGLAGTLICGASMGFFFGLGVNTSKSIFKATNNFSFNSVEDIVTSDSDDTTGAVNTSGTLVTSSDEVTTTVNKVKNSIVNITIKAQTQNFFNQTQESEGSGSGIIYAQDDDKVYIVTNNHVVEDATTVSISITGEESVSAKLVGKDAASDLAVISVLKTDLKSAGINEVTPAVFGNSTDMQVGESVIAIGNAMGQGKSATMGIISAQNKEINIDGKKLKVIQTDAAINPGNSGGALVNMDGEVIGINTAKLSSDAVEGTGYAIPTDVAKDVIQTLVENGTVEKPYLGISGYTLTDDIKNAYNIPVSGVLIVDVQQGSAAEKAGIKSYDIVTSIDGVAVSTIEELSEEIAKHKVGDEISLEIVRNGDTKATVKAVLQNLNEQF
jgi:serine protease Do